MNWNWTNQPLLQLAPGAGFFCCKRTSIIHNLLQPPREAPHRDTPSSGAVCPGHCYGPRPCCCGLRPGSSRARRLRCGASGRSRSTSRARSGLSSSAKCTARAGRSRLPHSVASQRRDEDRPGRGGHRAAAMRKNLRFKRGARKHLRKHLRGNAYRPLVFKAYC